MAKKQFHSGATPATTVEKKGIPLFVKIGSALLVILVIGVAAAAAYHYYTFQQKVKAQIEPPSEPKALIEQVGKLMELPLNEEPTIATVSDVEKLKDQPFFTSAQNGDKVLIYQKAKKAILYRPSTKKIVEVGPVNIDPSQTASSSAEVSGTPPALAKNLEVSLYNGTKRSGLTRRAETQLGEKYKDASVVEKTNSKNDYKETVVIDISGKNKPQAAALAKIVGGKVISFPKGEATPSAQILIILGDNYQVE
jgi:hypothetical protein